MFGSVIFPQVNVVLLYPSIKNATIALEHKAAFEALLDYLIIWCFGQDSMLHKEDPFCHCVVYLLYKISIHIGVWICCMTQGSMVPYFHSKYCPVLCLLLLGKAPFTLWHWFQTMGQIPWAIFCCFPHSGKPLWVPGCKLWMIYEVFLWHAAPGSSFVVRKVVCLCACIWPQFFFFFNNLTSFIFSHCEITIA